MEVAGWAAASEEVFIFLARYFLRWATVRRAEVRRYGFSSRTLDAARSSTCTGACW